MWNNRFIKTDGRLGLYEVFYKDDVLVGHCEVPEIVGEDADEIIEMLKFQLEDAILYKEKILTPEDFKEPISE